MANSNMDELLAQVEDELGGLSDDERSLVLRLLAEGHSLDEVIAAIRSNRRKRTPGVR